jgi:F-type H+-transporting ATPase subunit delta
VTAAKYPRGEGLARAYAQAAYEHTTQGWLSTLKTVQERLAADPNLIAYLDDSEASFAERRARLDVALPADTRADVKNFLYLLLREGHLELLGEVIADLERLATRGPETPAARVTSAVPLTSDEKEAFRRRIHKRYGSDVEIHFQVDPSILGGVIVQVGDKVIDGSITSRLTALHDRLVMAR